MRNSTSLAGKILLPLALLAEIVSAKTIKVQSGESIQAAINRAVSGDEVNVAKGTYPEQLTITKSGIKLVGKDGATLVPPETFATNICTGLTDADNVTQAGICVSGGGIELETFDSEHRKVHNVGTYVEDVTVRGLAVHGFSGLNIALVGAKNAVVRGNTVSDGQNYGILTVGSLNTKITENTILSSGLPFIGICFDDRSPPTITENEVSDYQVGLCVQTNGAYASRNIVTNCCVGAFIDPNVTDATFTHNEIIGPTNLDCFGPKFGLVAGIVVDGATRAKVSHNKISDVTNLGIPDIPYPPPAIWLANFAGVETAGNLIEHNKMRHNDFNVLITTLGQNKIKHNQCSNPSDNCNFQ